mmetsp:Transcript_1863/g.4261  ORF Transcript_1863/g.4261 Transcript_1863/m.4261 type:complete len:228 (-) Transcript_1863:683-1366(-)
MIGQVLREQDGCRGNKIPVRDVVQEDVALEVVDYVAGDSFMGAVRLRLQRIIVIDKIRVNALLALPKSSLQPSGTNGPRGKFAVSTQLRDDFVVLEGEAPAVFHADPPTSIGGCVAAEAGVCHRPVFQDVPSTSATTTTTTTGRCCHWRRGILIQVGGNRSAASRGRRPGSHRHHGGKLRNRIRSTSPTLRRKVATQRASMRHSADNAAGTGEISPWTRWLRRFDIC